MKIIFWISFAAMCAMLLADGRIIWSWPALGCDWLIALGMNRMR